MRFVADVELRIFSLLDCDSLLSCSQVCTAWRTLIQGHSNRRKWITSSNKLLHKPTANHTISFKKDVPTWAIAKSPFHISLFGKESRYFEVEVIEISREPDTFDSGTLYIGLVQPHNCSVNVKKCSCCVDKDPADIHFLGDYHITMLNSAGWTYFGGSFTTTHEGPKFHSGDTVGVGYIPSFQSNTLGIVYYTMNGSYIGESPYQLSLQSGPIKYNYHWHAGIYSTANAIVRINDGYEKFLYQLANDGNVFEEQFKEKYQTVVDDDLINEKYQTGNDHEAFVMVPNFPINWNDNDIKPPITDGYLIEFKDNGEYIATCCQSANPLVPFEVRRYCYFEVEILEVSLIPFRRFISIGLATKPYCPFHHIGWDAFSIAYHSDDGFVYQSSITSGNSFNAPFGLHDIIGCGYFSGGDVFFTLNGALLGNVTAKNHEWPANFGKFKHKVYASVAASRSFKVDVNVGQKEFKYKS